MPIQKGRSKISLSDGVPGVEDPWEEFAGNIKTNLHAEGRSHAAHGVFGTARARWLPCTRNDGGGNSAAHPRV
jgi:hypothetical protein